jgi:hypothetical protein
MPNRVHRTIAALRQLVPPFAPTFDWPILLCASSLILFVAPAVAQSGGGPGGALRPGVAALPTAINQPPDANTQMQKRDQQSILRNFDAANALRKQHLAEETQQLLLLARDFNARLSQLKPGPLPITLLRESELIEALAHDVHVKMVLTVE